MRDAHTYAVGKPWCDYCGGEHWRKNCREPYVDIDELLLPSEAETSPLTCTAGERGLTVEER